MISLDWTSRNIKSCTSFFLIRPVFLDLQWRWVHLQLPCTQFRPRFDSVRFFFCPSTSLRPLHQCYYSKPIRQAIILGGLRPTSKEQEGYATTISIMVWGRFEVCFAPLCCALKMRLTLTLARVDPTCMTLLFPSLRFDSYTRLMSFPQLLRSPTFHSVVRTVHKRVHELRYGRDPADLGGTKIDQPGVKEEVSRFFKFYLEELQNQFKKK